METPRPFQEAAEITGIVITLVSMAESLYKNQWVTTEMLLLHFNYVYVLTKEKEAWTHPPKIRHKLTMQELLEIIQATKQLFETKRDGDVIIQLRTKDHTTVV